MQQRLCTGCFEPKVLDLPARRLRPPQRRASDGLIVFWMDDPVEFNQWKINRPMKQFNSISRTIELIDDLIEFDQEGTGRGEALPSLCNVP